MTTTSVKIADNPSSFTFTHKKHPDTIFCWDHKTNRVSGKAWREETWKEYGVYEWLNASRYLRDGKWILIKWHAGPCANCSNYAIEDDYLCQNCRELS